MLISDYKTIGSKLWVLRKRAGLTQEELSEKAELSYRAYADIERGNVNMRIETFLNICKALNITPNDILTEQENNQNDIDIEEKLKTCTSKEKETALNLLTVYLKSL
ncbi:MAG: helix-turn-helix transcriptional regulator [Clostridia bacterium]|nr:helix-turn-helix transcriptional regulator [Clostridia bacterium]